MSNQCIFCDDIPLVVNTVSDARFCPDCRSAIHKILNDYDVFDVSGDCSYEYGFCVMKRKGHALIEGFPAEEYFWYRNCSQPGHLFLP